METPETKNQDITELLANWRAGQPEALEQLAPKVIVELRRLAAFFHGRERANHTLQPTALVNEAFLKLIDRHDIPWRNRAQFFAVCSKIMRRVLVDYARVQNAAKRQVELVNLPIEDAARHCLGKEMDLVRLNDALMQLAKHDRRQSRIVELRFFGGLNIEETSQVLGVSTATVVREWSMAKAWLYRYLRKGSPTAPVS